MPPKKETLKNTLHLPPPESQKVVESLFRTIASGVKELKSVLSNPPHPHSQADAKPALVHKRLMGKQKPPDHLVSVEQIPVSRRVVGKQSPPENLKAKQAPVRRRYTMKQPPTM